LSFFVLDPERRLLTLRLIVTVLALYLFKVATALDNSIGFNLLPTADLSMFDTPATVKKAIQRAVQWTNSVERSKLHSVYRALKLGNNWDDVGKKFLGR